MRMIKKTAALFIAIFFCGIFFMDLYSAVKVRIRDIAYIDGLKDNQVFGFGIVAGLQGTGDSKSFLLESSMKNVLKNLGITEEKNFKTKNIAAVLLTGKLSPFVRVGDRIDVTVSSIGNAKSLEGGMLIQSPLKGGDGEVYVVCQGPLAVSKSLKSGRQVKTGAVIVKGGLVEKAIAPKIVKNNGISLVLREWNYSAANSIVESVKEAFEKSNPVITPDGKIRIGIPGGIAIGKFISTIENIKVAPDIEARVVINERDGTIVMGSDVRVSEVIVSKDGMTIRVEGNSKPGASAVIRESASVKDLVDSLNFIGVSTRDIISILKAMKEAGALHARLIVK